MSKDAILTIKLESELREAFVSAVREDGRPASQVMRELMREYIEKQTAHENYQAWLERKVERARESMRTGRALDNEQVEAEFAALRNEAMKVAEP